MIDLLLNEVSDLHIQNADIMIGNSDEQQQELLLIAQKGSIKQYPEVGVGIVNYLMSAGIDKMIREIRYQFEADGMQISSVAYDERTNSLTHDAHYSS